VGTLPPNRDGRPLTDAERRQRAHLAYIRQEFLAPARAIVGYAEILRDEGSRLKLEHAASDLGRILTAAQSLIELVERLLDSDARSDQQASEAAGDVQERLRHDLRTPLNAVKGYAELLLEDSSENGDALREDLGKLLTESAQLLANLDIMVDLSGRDAPPTEDIDASTGAMIADLLRTVRPLSRDSSEPRAGGRILVVDDNASNRALLLRRLAREGHAAIEAASGLAALEALTTEEVDLVLLDLIMPDMNGLEVLGRLKTDPRLREIPVIMISGLQDTDSVIRCIEAGAEDYLPKPFDPVLLRARIGASLERKRWHDRERHYLARLATEKERSEALLRNILPEPIISRLNGGERVIADRLDEVTIVFCDLVGFTEIAARTSPPQLVNNLNHLFTAFDGLTRLFGIEKIKTIGDAYMAAAGLPKARPDHAEAAAELALGMLDAVEQFNSASETDYRVRIGMDTGPVVAGIIGAHRFIYDVWGDTVNVASRLEAHGSPGRIHVSEQTRRALEHRYAFESCGPVNIRGKGLMRTAFLSARLPA
jgi:adenylate cyclase